MTRIFDSLTRSRRSAGFSLLEVLIALTLTAIVTTAILRAYTVQHKQYMEQDDATAVQQNARAALDEIARHVRMAGNNLPLGLNALEMTNADPDTITIIYRVDDCDTYLADTMASTNSVLECASAVDCFSAGQWAYIFEPDSGGGEWFQVSAVNVGGKQLEHDGGPLSKIYHADAIILTMEQIRFFVDNTTDAAHPQLMMQLPGQAPQPFADNISGFELRYRMKNGMVVDQPPLVEDVREVEITVTGRSENPDPESADDRYRTRTYTSSVNLRNAGL
jgi:prepilin-type N-terminal cleavage/methylation domain-containing protein